MILSIGAQVLYIFENSIFFFLNCLKLQLNWTLQPIREKFFRVSYQKVHFSGRDPLSNKTSYSDEVELSLDDDFRAEQIMPSSCHESTNEYILH